MSSKRIIFLGNPIPEDQIPSKVVLNANVADNIAQLTMINGLDSYYDKLLTVVSVSPDNQSSELNIGNGIVAQTVKSSNKNRAVYYLSIAINYTKKLDEILKIHHSEDTVVITNGPYIYMALPIIIMRTRHKLKWVPFLIGAVEVPEERFPFSLVSGMSKWAIKKASGAITYVARSIHDYMPGKPFVEIFYLIEDRLMKLYKAKQPKRPDKFTITYTGALTSIYNIDIVIDVIKKTGSRYRWVFAGIGQYADEIKKLADSDKYDVVYMGRVSNVEAIGLQKASHLLLCLRGGAHSKSNQYYSRYAASGKLTEYLCSGVPILAGDIPSFSDKIKPFLNSVKDQSRNQIISNLAEIEEDYTARLKLARQGQKYAHRNFTEDRQNRAIYELLESL